MYSPSIKGKALEEEILSLIARGAVELAPLPSLGFYSRVFVVWKTSGSWRPVIDLSVLNRFKIKTPFKMETLKAVLLSVRQGDWMVSLDLKDPSGQLQVPKVYSFRQALPIPGSLFWSLHGSAGLHQGYGSGLDDSALVRYPDPPVLGRLADPGSVSGASSRSSGGCTLSLSRAGYCDQPNEVQSGSFSAGSLSRDCDRFCTFQGFSFPVESREAALNW